MKISVIIPAYNGAATLAGAIESILRQTRAPEEIVVCDDCSTDATREVAARYSGRVQCVGREVNGGLSANRNTAIQASRGDWFLFLDQDDELLPHALEALATTAEKSGAGSCLRLCPAPKRTGSSPPRFNMGGGRSADSRQSEFLVERCNEHRLRLVSPVFDRRGG